MTPKQRRRRHRENPEVANEQKEDAAKEDTAKEDAVKKDGIPFMLGELEKQEKTVEDEAVDQRIEAARSPYPPNTELSNVEWENFRAQIEESFTAGQLMGYVSGRQPTGQLHQTSQGAMEWRPGTSMFLEDDKDSQAGVTHRLVKSQSLKGKKLLAERILRDHWRLGVVAEVGQQDIRLPEHWITVLMNSENFSFEEIARLNDANIDITHSLGLVRITGPRAVCESISEIILDATKRIREDDFELSPEAHAKFKDAFTPDLLDWVRKSYGVSFTMNSQNYPSKILYLVENKGGAESARRNLNLATRKDPSVTPFSTYLSSSVPASIYAVDPESKASYFDRKKSWFRWAMSSTQSTEGTILDTPFFNEHQTDLPNVLLNVLRPGNSATRSKGSTADTHESITAAVGRCLFMRKPSQPIDYPVSASDLAKMSVPRTFISDIPKMTSFLRSLEQTRPEDHTQRHRIRLFPTAVNADTFPELELEIAVKDTESPSGPGNELSLRSAKAILSENSVDFLLPENDLDLRFNRTIHYNLLDGSPNAGLGDQGIQSLGDTMNKSLRGIISFDHESTTSEPLPSFCHISLPKRVLKRSPSGTANPDDLVSAEYMFQPVNDAQGTQVYRYDFQGQQLNYIFYESGPFFASHTADLFVGMDVNAGGEAQVSSDSDGNASSQDEAAAVRSRFDAFYKNACRLAFELDRAWRVS